MRTIPSYRARDGEIIGCVWCLERRELPALVGTADPVALGRWLRERRREGVLVAPLAGRLQAGVRIGDRTVLRYVFREDPASLPRVRRRSQVITL